MNITQFIDYHYRHFNAATLKDAAQAYKSHVDSGGKMLVTLAGAMSTAELGLSLAEMIRQDKVHAISCTAANAEEDLFHLVAANHYKRIPNYRELTPEDEHELERQNLNRVTDTCIPEEEAMRVLESALDEVWTKADKAGIGKLPHEFWYEIIDSGVLKDKYQKDPKESWMLAACEKKIPMFIPAYEDSTCANMGAGRILLGKLSPNVFKSGQMYMVECMKWYMDWTLNKKWNIGFFQIGGGCAGDFPICVRPTIMSDFRGIFPEVPSWGYFCQISDSTTSYGSYSGAVPNEKITWKKLTKDTPRFVIESDASIVAPLIFNYVLGL
jgi:deoxyhypusine synthase